MSKHSRSSLSCLIGLAIVTSANIQVWGLDPGLPPGGNFDLSHFKAGSYCQDNSGPSTEGARVAFYSLAAGHPPTLDITVVGADVVLSWPTNGASGYDLESAPSMTSTVWSAAGTPTKASSRNVSVSAFSNTAIDQELTG